MEEIKQLTCGFWFFNKREPGRCGKPATHQFHKNPLCEDCAKYVRSLGRKVEKMSDETVQKKLAYQNQKVRREAFKTV